MDLLEAPDVSGEELIASMPPAVREAFPTFAWDVERLWNLRLPVESVPVESFSWLLGLPIWRWAGKRWQLSISDVLERPHDYAAHMTKAMATDLGFPVHATNHRSRMVILDGYHRLLKALVLQATTIDVMEVTVSALSRS